MLKLPSKAFVRGLLLRLLGEDDSFKIKGRLRMELRGEDGELKQVYEKDNLITTVGFQFIADCIGNGAARPSVISHIGVGTGVTAAAVGDTALQTQLTRLALTYSYAAKVITVGATFNAGVATGAITEAGVFNGAAGSIMLNHVVFGTITKGASDILTVTFTFTLS